MAPKFHSFIVLFVFVVIGKSSGDYQCLCNYNIEIGVMPTASDQGDPIGFLYEFDCKESIQSLSTNEWLAIAFEHKVGYIKADPQTQEQICQGSPPGVDRVTTTTTIATTTPNPTTTQPATTSTSTPTSTTSSSTTSTTSSTTTASTTPTTARPSTSTEQATTTTTFKPSTRIPTTLKTTTQQPTTSTQTSTTSTPSTTTSTTTTARPTSTTTKTTTPTTVYNAPTTTVKVVSGKPKLCPQALRTRVQTDRNILTQYDNSCYEIVTNGQAPWANAETYCKHYGGHLVALNTRGEQIFITNYLRHNYYHDVWTGLDQKGNNQLLWSTGDIVSFVNWNTTVKNVSQTSESCVLLSPSDSGMWYDKPCQTYFNYICEYELHAQIQTQPFIQTKPVSLLTKPSPTIDITVSGRPELCPSSLIYHVKDAGSHLTQNGNMCYETVENQMIWPEAEQYCRKFGGHLVSIQDSQEQDFIYRYLIQNYKHSVWIGLSDSLKEGKFLWVSGLNSGYRNWYQERYDYSSSYEDCALLTVYHNGQWDDRECTSPHSFMCEYNINGAHMATTPTSAGSSVPGDTSRCPSKIRSKANQDGGNLGYYSNSCYELIPDAKVSHEHALEMCYNRGGELVDILNQAEQNYVQAFLKMFSPQHAVWTGLHDKYTENYFEWDSGARVQYTNWLPGHTSNFVNHRQEDCVVIIPYKDGKWDDIPCGSQSFLFGDSGETHPPLCEYKLQGNAFIG